MNEQIEAALALIKVAIDLQNESTAKLQHAADVLSVSDSGQVGKLNVAWIGQNTSLTTDDYSPSDCGPAVVAMWLNFIGKIVTVDDVSAATGLTRGYRYTMPGNLILAAGHWGLSLERVIGFTLDMIRAQIDKAVPCIVLVHYGSLPWRYDQVFNGGHYILIVGYSEGSFYYHDPYWPDSHGSFLSMTDAQLTKAMQDCTIDGNTPMQGLRSKAK